MFRLLLTNKLTTGHRSSVMNCCVFISNAFSVNLMADNAILLASVMRVACCSRYILNNKRRHPTVYRNHRILTK